MKSTNRHNKGQQEGQQGRGLLHDFAAEGGPGIIEPLDQIRVLHHPRLIDLGLPLVGEEDLVVLDLYPADVLLLGHGHEGAIVHFLDFGVGDQGHDQPVEHQQQQEHNAVVIGKGLFRLFYLIHKIPPVFILLLLQLVFFQLFPHLFPHFLQALLQGMLVMEGTEEIVLEVPVAGSRKFSRMCFLTAS